ncbi:nuclear receptor subfamily 1 group I member 2 isoform X1 [Cyprinodon tularosa]|uniref:nuclear receptor subfamily 1 group I member 2 isoform X1 n=1 Tax=Cyprinodon tularosa TaxID=77115 RepID=UPI0018E220E3|nr:nuclear receptor subfamily 1 group I member 2 isoform X1 [Cyprinodon tularosa]XP_038163950.1 nuclear receptor subfamily 1 group I member 2 isoform X1 [Cyprinodon tularosa]XP_038163952.1 nuclear receptor subfamily 1 group I member 2 isoform X1 [Cyprinodon tularosa]
MSLKAAGIQAVYEALTVPHEEEEEEEDEGKTTEDEEPRACGVCGDRAKGYHFNALTCEGCKGFFRRAIKRSTQLRCPFLNKCTITKNNRRSCQACRFRKCQAIGMRKDMVMSEEEVLERRIRIKKKKIANSTTELSFQQEKMVEELLCSLRNTFDSTFSRFTGFRPRDRDILAENQETTCPTKTCSTADKPAAPPTTPPYHCSLSPVPSSPSFSSSTYYFPSSFSEKVDGHLGDKSSFVYTNLPHLSDLTTYMIQDIIRFSKSLQDFRSLSIEDQISLLKGATFEMMQIRFNMVFNTSTNNWECGHITYCIHDAVRGGFQPLLLEPIFKFHHNLRKLDLGEEEYALIQALSLFSPDRQGVQQHATIDRVRENLALTLKTWIDCKKTGPKKLLLYPKLIACLTELRTMTEEYSKQVLQIQEVQPDTISPLMMEVVSKNPCKHN